VINGDSSWSRADIVLSVTTESLDLSMKDALGHTNETFHLTIDLT